MKCLRCGRDFEDPVPSVLQPDGDFTEIMCRDWCSDCNKIGLLVVYRGKSIYTDPLPETPEKRKL